MISVRVEITCDGCGVLHEGVRNEVVADARLAMEAEGWITHKFCGRIFDFCPDCSAEEEQAARSAAG